MEIQEIKKIISVQQLLERLGAKFNEDGKSCCIFHNEKTPSLSCYHEEEGEVKFKCFGCGKQGDIFDAIGYVYNLDKAAQIKTIKDMYSFELSSDLKPSIKIYKSNNGKPKKEKKTFHIDYIKEKAEAIYSYYSATGKLEIIIVVWGRKEGKKIIGQYAPIEDGKFINAVSNIKYGIYRLPELLKSTGPIYITEGEKDTDNLRSWGFTATSARGGSQQPWNPENNKYFIGRDVIFIRDDDSSGRDFGNSVIESLSPVVKSIKCLDLPVKEENKNKGHDFTDWVKAGGTRDEFIKLSAEAELRGIDGIEIRKAEETDPLPGVTVPIEIKARRKSKLQKLTETEDYLKSNYKFKYNEITKKTEYTEINQSCWKEITDNIISKFYFALLRRGIDFNRDDIWSLLANPDFSEVYNPFKEYFDNIPQWDKKDHIKIFTDCFKLKNENDREAFEKSFKKWFVGILTGVYNSKWCNHVIFIITGEQGDGKTTILNELIPENLYEYLQNGGLEFGTKDSKMAMCCKLLINIDELESFTKKNIDQLKSNITAKDFDIRLPYGRVSEKLSKRCSFMASTNRTSFLSDPTGSRRFLIFEISEIEYEKKFDINQMYSQAKHLYFSNFTYWFTREEIKEINKRNEQFSADSPEEQLLLQYFIPYKGSIDLVKQLDEPSRKKKGLYFLSTTEIATEISKATEGRISINNSFVRRLGGFLRKHNFKKTIFNQRYTWCVKNCYRYEDQEENEYKQYENEAFHNENEEYPIPF